MAVAEAEHTSIVAALWRYWFTSLVIVLLAMAVSYGVGMFVQPDVRASASIALVTPPQGSVVASGVQGEASLARYTTQRARFLTSDAVLSRVSEQVDLPLSQLREAIVASASSSANVVTVTAEAAPAVRAVELANAVVDAYRAASAEQVDRLTDTVIESLGNSTRTVGSLTPAATQLLLEASRIRVSSDLFGDGVDFVVAARLDDVVNPGPPVRETALGAIVGLVIAATIAWLRADRRT